jgi:alcohol dehydrogenase class IV
VSSRANALTDALCRDGIRRAAVQLPRAYANGLDAEARESMSLVSLYGGLALANAGLGVVHGFAAPIGGMFDAPHGAVCAALLPHGMRANIGALKDRMPGHPSIERYREIARIFAGETEDVTPEEGVEQIHELCNRLKVQPLRAYGIEARHIPDLVEKAAKASSMKANPVVLTASELTAVLEAAW